MDDMNTPEATEEKPAVEGAETPEVKEGDESAPAEMPEGEETKPEVPAL